jgi:RNA polymerase sigma-70 factor (ECF subfamily)
MTETRDEETLWLHAASGDSNALGALLMLYEARLGHKARMLGLQEPDVADAVQETFVRALLAWRTLRNPSALGSWLERILGNVTIDWGRKLSRRPRTLMSEPAKTVDIPSADLDRLRESQNILLRLRYLEGLTGPEMAARLGLPLETVKKRLQRARASALKVLRTREAT